MRLWFMGWPARPSPPSMLRSMARWFLLFCLASPDGTVAGLHECTPVAAEDRSSRTARKTMEKGNNRATPWTRLSMSATSTIAPLGGKEWRTREERELGNEIRDNSFVAHGGQYSPQEVVFRVLRHCSARGQ
uniref:Putative secreted protein n=1 Tax=Anopheles darlingi TaxID=43151 RepID=A0A2M4D727_ANODA